MKPRNKLTVIFVLFVFLSAGILMSAISRDYDGLKFDLLKKKALEKGLVPILVKMNVPCIETLTAASAQFKTGISDQSYIQSAYNADKALDQAISQARESVLQKLDGQFYKIHRTFSTLPYIAMTVNAATLEKIKSIPEIVNIVEDRAIPLPKYTVENSSVAAGLDDKSSPKVQQSTGIVGADVAWSMGYSGIGWYVAILDSGLRKTHEMFDGKQIVEQCYSRGENYYDTAGDCPNNQTEMSGSGSAAPYNSKFGHGTHVAGIAAGNNHRDRYGVAKDANIIAVQVFSYFPDYDEVLSWVSDHLKGLEYIYSARNTYKIAAANLSLGGNYYDDYCDEDWYTPAVNNLESVGIATTISSGNEEYCGATAFPACISKAVTVDATNKSDQEYYAGNWHDVIVDLMAPGVSISSATAGSDHIYEGYTGTSMAAPHVAGAWAILKQFNQGLTVNEIQTVLQDYGKPIGSLRCTTSVTKPRINIDDSLLSFFTIAPPLNLNTKQETNQSFLQTEYINVISWEANPLNEFKNIFNYKIYTVQNSQLTLLVQIPASSSSTAKYIYWHRKAEKEKNMIYAVTAVNDEGEEGPPAYYQLSFTTN